MAGKNPIKFTDTTFRDGHQSLLATRMRSEDIIPFMARMDQMGYFAIEVWGGATFDTTHRFLGDDPWERIRTIKGILKKTPTMMLLRGQNLVGYRNYADDLTYRFVRYAAEAGVDIFRVFDALNDMRNWEVAVKALMDAKKAGPHGPLPGRGVLLADPAAHGRAHLQPGLLRQLCQKVRGHGGRLGGLEGHGRDVLPQRRLRHHQGDEGDHQDPGGVPHPLHLGLGLHELLEGHRGRGGRAGHLLVPLCAPDLPAGHRAAHGGGGADRPGNRHGPGRA